MVSIGMYSDGQVHHRYSHVRGRPGIAAIAAFRRSASFQQEGRHVVGHRERSASAASVVVTQRIEAAPSISRGRRFSLGDFTGANYSKGRSWPVQLLWMAVSRYITMQWWCPNQLRVAVLRAFGARIGTGTLVRHDVKIHWPWKLEIGEHSLMVKRPGSSTSSRSPLDRIPVSPRAFCCAPAATTDSAPPSSSTMARSPSGMQYGSPRGRRSSGAFTSPTARRSALPPWSPAICRRRHAVGPSLTSGGEVVKITIVGINYFPEVTGIAPYTTGMAEGLAAYGHEVNVVTGLPHYPEWRVYDGYRSQRSYREIINGVTVDRLRHYVPEKPSPRDRIRMEASFARAALAAGFERPSVVIAVSPALLSTAGVVAAARLKKVPVGVVVQDLYGKGVVETGAMGGKTADLAANSKRESCVRRQGCRSSMTASRRS